MISIFKPYVLLFFTFFCTYSFHALAWAEPYLDNFTQSISYLETAQNTSAGYKTNQDYKQSNIQTEEEIYNDFMKSRRQLGDLHLDTITLFGKYVGVLESIGKHREAISILEEYLNLFKISKGENSAIVKAIKGDIAKLYIQLGDYASAESISAGSTFTEQGRHKNAIDKAKKDYEDARSMYKKINYYVLVKMYDYVNLYYSLDDFEFVYIFLKKNIPPLSSFDGVSKKSLLSLYKLYYESALNTGRKNEAKKIYSQYELNIDFINEVPNENKNILDVLTEVEALYGSYKDKEARELLNNMLPIIIRRNGKYGKETVFALLLSSLLHMNKQQISLSENQLYEAHARYLMTQSVLSRNFTYLTGMLRLFALKDKSRESAIFWDKVAIMTSRAQRSSNVGLERQTQLTFFNKFKEIYHSAIESLLAMGRKKEAFFVLNLYKEAELDDFSRGKIFQENIAEDFFSPQELVLYEQYLVIQAGFKNIGGEIIRLENKKQSLSSQESERLTELTRQAELLRDELIDFTTKVHSTLVQTPSYLNVGAKNLQLVQKLLSHMQSSVFIHTVTFVDKVFIFLTTPKYLIVKRVTINQEDIQNLVVKFRTELMNPQLNPQNTAEKIYDILMKPISKILQEENPKTLVFSLDGNLRYIPMSALHDGAQWLVENYDVALFTDAARTALLSKNALHTSITALGVTKAHGSFSSLPAVENEIKSIVKKGNTGILSGDYFLDSDFTLHTLQGALQKKTPILHIASHFSFTSEDQKKSFLLLGDGTTLTMGDMFDSQKGLSFAHVDLLTLSACNTGSGVSAGNGREIESFGALAQQRGARTVMASLWPVSDASTAALMSEFYSQLALATKGTALAQTQRDFLQKKITAQSTYALRTQRGKVLSSKTEKKMSSNNDWSHPFFWSSFILMGNWN